jgi:alanine racemase
VPLAKIHVLNSAGILEFPGHAYDLVRPGLMLYGSAYPEKFQPLLRPALTWKARVLLVRSVGPNRGVSYGRTFITHRPMRIAAPCRFGRRDNLPGEAGFGRRKAGVRCSEG